MRKTSRWGTGAVAGVAMAGSLLFVAQPTAAAAPVLPPLPQILDRQMPDLDISGLQVPAIEIDAMQRAAIMAAVFDATGVLIQEVAGLVAGDETIIPSDAPATEDGGEAVTTGSPFTSGLGGSRLPLDAGSFELTSGFGGRDNPTGSGRQNHQGVDMAAPEGTPIYAVTGGTVVQAGDAGDGYGNLVRIKSGNTEVYYGHQVSGGIKVQVGDVIKAGQRIGSVGSTGNSTGNHLHFEVRRDGSSVDPMGYLSTLGLNVRSAARD